MLKITVTDGSIDERGTVYLSDVASYDLDGIDIVCHDSGRNLLERCKLSESMTDDEIRDEVYDWWLAGDDTAGRAIRVDVVRSTRAEQMARTATIDATWDRTDGVYRLTRAGMPDLWSGDGDEWWIDLPASDPLGAVHATDDEFCAASIRLVGGPRNGDIVA